MRFISKFGKMIVQVRAIQTEAYASGGMSVATKPLYARFDVGQLRPEERELALNTWTFNGLYQEQDEVTIVPPDYRIGLFDSVQAQVADGWSDEERQLVENDLTKASLDLGDIIVVPRTMVEPPWPRYDDFPGTTEALINRLVDDGYDLERTLQYERDMQNRPDVVEALELALGGMVGIPLEEEVLG